MTAAAVASPRRWIAAVAAAAASDLLFDLALPSGPAGFLVPIAVLWDVATAAVLWWLLRSRGSLLVPLALEAIPGIALFPTWTAYVAFLRVAGAREKRARDGQAPRS